MNKNYIKFIIAYDFCHKLEEMELACDEAFDLADKIADKYMAYTKENGIDQYYETLYEYCEEISFKKVWEQMIKEANANENLL